ncbi:hypothetical protein WN944_004646 [Citrus x changshan-huyou]|uniref:Defensin-like protein n=1 Tax=Citrus x changshan-huyou TaxID=2935761 RepID=A0AAP0M0R6_9ROSI
MAKLSFNNIFVFLLILSAALMAVPRVDAQVKRCEEKSNPNCSLEDCRAKCINKYINKRGFGECIENGAHTGYDCYCFWDC